MIYSACIVIAGFSADFPTPFDRKLARTDEMASAQLQLSISLRKLLASREEKTRSSRSRGGSAAVIRRCRGTL